MKKLSLVFIAILGLSCFLNAQGFQNSFPDINDENQWNSSKQHHLDLLESSNTLKSANGLVFLRDSIYGFSFNSESVWEGTYKLYISYDYRGNIVGYLEKDWNEDTGDYVNGYDELGIYDENNHQIKYYSMKWNTDTQVWDSTQIIQSLYDEFGNRTERLYQKWNSELSDWVNNSRYSYKYDENGNQIEFLHEIWSLVSSTWNNSSLYTSEYNLEGLKTMEIRSVANTVGGIFAWKNYSQSIYYYDDNSNMLLLESKKWDATNEIWINNYVYRYVYNSNEALDVRIYQSYNVTEEAYFDVNRIMYSYDEFVNLRESVRQSWNLETSTWVSTSKDIYYYSQHDVTEAEILELANSIIIYPNPAENEISLSNITELSTVSIHDINGKLFIQREVDSNKTILSVSQLPRGLYLMKISNVSGQQVLKFIKR